MDIYDGRRAVVGDLVECIMREPWVSHPAVILMPEPKKGERLYVNYLEIEDKKYLGFAEYGDLIFASTNFRIIPKDSKSTEPAIKFTGVKQDA